MVFVVLGVDEVFGISILGGKERGLNVEVWGLYFFEVCKRDVYDGFFGWLSLDFCFMNVIF